MENPLIASSVQDLTGVDSKVLSSQLASLESFTKGDKMDQIQSLTEILYNLTQCVDVKFEAADSEEQLENRAAELQQVRKLLGGKLRYIPTCPDLFLCEQQKEDLEK